MSEKPRFLATGIGSMPFTDAGKAVDISLTRLPEALFWPQLPQLSFREKMEIQFSEGMPGLIVDEEKQRIHFATFSDYSEAFAQFYELYMAAMDSGDCSAAAISPAYCRGINALEKRLIPLTKKLPYIKVQTTGPCSFALTTVDENKRAIYYHEEFRDVIIKALAMKCRWQIQKFTPFAGRIICFIDEPILSAFGSSTYISVKREDVVSHLAEMIEAIHADGALAGIHCCGNTEWSILIDAGVDIVNFDAYNFGQTIAMYPQAVKSHLQKGGMLAWGIVPTSPAILEETVESLVDWFEQTIDILAVKGIDKQLIAEQAIITPSCGTGSLTPELAGKVFDMILPLSSALREKYRF